MGDLERTIDIIFAGVDNLSGELRTMGRNVDAFGSDLQDIGQPFADAQAKVALLQGAILGLGVAMITARANTESEAQKMANSLGLTTQEAKKFGNVAKDVYRAGLLDDITQAFDAVTLAQKKFGDDSDTDIGKVVENAAKIAKAFDIDIADAMSASKTLMTNFGITSDQSFDFLTTGFRDGLNGSDDFIESINEYSTQFRDGGADAGQFFTVLSNGFQEGVLGTDKAADLFKEFRLRIVDESTTTREALESLGIDVPAFEANMASGKTTAMEAFTDIMGKLGETKNKTDQFNLAVALMGTPFEDLGTTAGLALLDIKHDIEDMEGAASNLTFGDVTTQMTSAWRTAIGAVEDLDVWANLGAKAADTAGDIAGNIQTVLRDMDFSGVEQAFNELWDTISGIFSDADLDLTTIEGVEEAVRIVSESVESILNVTKGQFEIWGPIFIAFKEMVDSFNSMDSGTKELAGNIIAIGAGLVTLGGAVAAGGALLSGLSSLVALLSGPVGLAAAFAGALLAYNNWANAPIEQAAAAKDKAIEDHAKAVKDLTEQLDGIPLTKTSEVFLLIEKGDLDGAQELITELTEEEKEVRLKAEVDAKELNEFNTNLAEISDEAQVEITALMNAGKYEEAQQLIEDLGAGKEIELGVKVDSADITVAKETISWFDENGTEHKIEVASEGVDTAKKEIEKIPTTKELEIILQGEIDKDLATIETNAENLQAAVEWKAKLDIAEAQAAAEILSAAFDAASQSVENTSQASSNMFDALVENMSGLSTMDKWAMQDVLDDQMDMQQQALDMQKELTEAQAEYLRATAEALKNGDSLIKIDGTGLSPALEMVMWEIIEKVQVRATAEASEFLLGI